MNKEEVNTYVALKYFPIILSGEYLETLPDYCLCTLYTRAVVGNITNLRYTANVYIPSRPALLGELLVCLDYHLTYSTRLSTTLIVVLKDSLIEYYSDEERFTGKSYYNMKVYPKCSRNRFIMDEVIIGENAY